MLNRAGLIRLLVLIGVLFYGRTGIASASPLEMTLEPLGGDLLEITLTNTSVERLSFLTWDTPFEDVMSADLFTIYLTGGTVDKKLPYQGRLVKRAMVGRGNYLTLEAGESVQVVLPLTIYYEVAIRGQYTVEYTGSLHIETAATSIARQITSNSKGRTADQHEFLNPEPATVELTPARESRAVLPANFYSCTSQQQAELEMASQVSENIALEAYEGLANLEGDARLNSPRYKYWFGDFSKARYAKVLSSFESISNVLSTRTLEFDCSCADSSLYAYVFRNRPFRIYPCPNFWASAVEGTDSRAGTIIHELTHFTVVSNTDDHQYGQIGVSSLAVSDPDLAVVNADSYEYFAENTPAIEISNPLQFTEIEIGSAVSGELISGQSSYYRVDGADFIELSSLSGDADLYIYESPALDKVVCRSLSLNSVDMCAHNPLLTAYIEVRGYTNTEFSLIAQLRDPESIIPKQLIASSSGTGIQPVTQLIAVATQGFSAGGNSGEEPADDQGGGVVGWTLFLFLFSRWFVLLIPYGKSRVRR